MKDHPKGKLFEAINLPRRELENMSGSYRVYKDAENYIVVKAASAKEALKASGLSQACRVQRDAVTNVLVPGTFDKPAAAANEPAKAEPAVAAATATPISGDQADKPLQG